MSTTNFTRAHQSDMLDEIAWKYYGKSSGAVEYMLADPRNYRLSDDSEVLLLGTIVVLPELTVSTTVSTVQLWGKT